MINPGGTRNLETVRRLVTLILGVVAIAAILFVLNHFRASLGLAGAQYKGNAGGVAANPSAHITWQTVNRASDGFQVEMPAHASQTSVPAYGEQGVQEPVNVIQASVDSETTYAIAWADNSPVDSAGQQDAQKTLDMARDGALARTQTALVSEVQNTRNGYPERDFQARNAGGGLLDARLILAGNRLYMLIATFPSANARREEDVKRFFNSFTLSSAAQPSPRNK